MKNTLEVLRFVVLAVVVEVLRFVVLAVVALVVMGSLSGSDCRIKPPPTPVEPKDTKYCPDACQRLRALGCPEGETLEDGTTCEQFCVDTQKSGHALRPLCVMDITSCDQVDQCTKGPREVFE